MCVDKWCVCLVCAYLMGHFGSFGSPHAQAARPKKARSITFSVVGDIMTHASQVKSAFDQSCQCYRFRPVFKEVRPYLRQADITIGNLETTLPGKRAGYTKEHQIIFGSPDTLASALKWAGFDLLITANNHMCDKGFSGLSRTLRVLDKHKLLHFGAYHSHKAYNQKRHMVLKIKGWRIALLSYTTHVNRCMGKQKRVNLLYWPQVGRDVRQARRKGYDAVIVHYHFGPEYVRIPDKAQRGAVRVALRAGADIVLGGHTHVLQPFKLMRYRNKTRLVAYSLGNFISNIRKQHTDGGMIFHFTLSRTPKQNLRIHKVSYTPVWVYKKQTKQKEHFLILPIEKYIKGKGQHALSAKDKAAMMRFYHSTRKHLRQSLRDAKQISLRSQ